MLNQQTLEKLYVMKLNAMADAFKEQIQQPDMNELAFEERFSLHWSAQPFSPTGQTTSVEVHFPET